MAKAHPFAVATLALATGCGDASPPGNAHTWSVDTTRTVELVSSTFGWDDPITTTNFDPAAAQPLGSASTAIVGHTVREIITDASVRVRGDANACVSCHAWAATDVRAMFCTRVPAFMALPTAKGDGSDPANAKPELLKTLLGRWHEAGCP